MEGEDISPAVALASGFATDPFEDSATNFFFGSDDTAGGANQTPIQEETATATATSAPNSPASATSNSAPPFQTVNENGTATAATGTLLGLPMLDWLLIAAGGFLLLHFMHK